MNKKYRYSGPQSGVTLRMPDGTEKEVLLHNGSEVSLPADHPWVVKAVLKGHLTELVPAAKPTKSLKEAPLAS